MTTSAVTKRLAATGLATVLTTSALVGASAASASAAPEQAKALGGGGATFSCMLPVLNLPVDVPLSLDGLALPTSLLADAPLPIPLGGLPLLGSLEVGGLLGLLGNLPLPIGQLGANLPGFDLLLGALELPISGLGSALGPISEITGIAGSLTGGDLRAPAKAGVYDVKLPSSFQLEALLPAPLSGLIPAFPCTIKDGENPTVGTVKVTKQRAAMNAQAKKAVIKKGKPAKVMTAVARQDGQAATGRVVALVGGKQVASKQLQNGRATLAVKKLGKGAKKIVVKYLGNGSTQSVKKTVKVTVKK
ncbi:Ig-like domain repeat protein [Nocardioides abyssi]|uniref:Uncharacterized protein n=1 Tax=Nocardioides abyssi TaxID=3058370 RepID=A0ABT8EVU0_9ACTN|nr:Ig-like domain repeat protein [Nocardioides abyssi]MDN4162298.1 hypothetical protein [Nocardioides abyssi]